MRAHRRFAGRDDLRDGFGIVRHAPCICPRTGADFFRGNARGACVAPAAALVNFLRPWRQFCDASRVSSRQIIVVGGGAAGFFAAIAAAEQGADVTLLEKTARFLDKVRISGGGRCNVTHACFDPREFATRYPRGGQALLSPFQKFSARDTVAWFESRGVKLKTEADGRMFPDDRFLADDCGLPEVGGGKIRRETAAELRGGIGRKKNGGKI